MKILACSWQISVGTPGQFKPKFIGAKIVILTSIFTRLSETPYTVVKVSQKSKTTWIGNVICKFLVGI